MSRRRKTFSILTCLAPCQMLHSWNGQEVRRIVMNHLTDCCVRITLLLLKDCTMPWCENAQIWCMEENQWQRKEIDVLAWMRARDMQSRATMDRIPIPSYLLLHVIPWLPIVFPSRVLVISHHETICPLDFHDQHQNPIDQHALNQMNREIMTSLSIPIRVLSFNLNWV